MSRGNVWDVDRVRFLRSLTLPSGKLFSSAASIRDSTMSNTPTYQVSTNLKFFGYSSLRIRPMPAQTSGSFGFTWSSLRISTSLLRHPVISGCGHMRMRRSFPVLWFAELTAIPQVLSVAFDRNCRIWQPNSSECLRFCRDLFCTTSLSVLQKSRRQSRWIYAARTSNLKSLRELSAIRIHFMSRGNVWDVDRVRFSWSRHAMSCKLFRQLLQFLDSTLSNTSLYRVSTKLQISDTQFFTESDPSYAGSTSLRMVHVVP